MSLQGSRDDRYSGADVGFGIGSRRVGFHKLLHKGGVDHLPLLFYTEVVCVIGRFQVSRAEAVGIFF